VNVNVPGSCVFTDNHCLGFHGAFDGELLVFIQAGAIIAGNNLLKYDPRSQQSVMALELQPERGPFTVLGNIATGPILVSGNPLGAPWNSLNVIHAIVP
jgi:hypothetical protein